MGLESVSVPRIPGIGIVTLETGATFSNIASGS